MAYPIIRILHRLEGNCAHYIINIWRSLGMWLKFSYSLLFPEEPIVPKKEWNVGFGLDNPEFSNDLFKYQDENLERVGKSVTDNEWLVDLPYALEAAGDIFREISDRKFPDPNYISEKLRKLHKVIDGDSPIWGMAISNEDGERLSSYILAWKQIASQLIPSGLLFKAMMVCINIAQRDLEGSKRALNDLENGLYRVLE